MILSFTLSVDRVANCLNMKSMGWKKSLTGQVIVVVQVHKEFVEVWNPLLEALPQPLGVVLMVARNASDVAEQEVTALD
jgi:hypothetical protein